MPRQKNHFYVYIVQTRTGSLYTGISTDVEKRVATHNRGTGAKALRGQLPVTLLWWSNLGTSRSEATMIEAKIKKLSRMGKFTYMLEQNAKRSMATQKHTMVSNKQASRPSTLQNSIFIVEGE